jgi:acetylornithine deacetylase/succinyl-diaminopimelate desuccinylase-like protein
MRVAILLALVAVAGCVTADVEVVVPPAPTEPEADLSAKQAVDLLRDLIKFDTINPPQPGSSKRNAEETALLKHVKGVLAADGLDSEILEPAAGRGNLVARYKGTGEKQPLLLMAHVDVVNVDPGQWEVDPLAAEVRDGFVWGRGALDDKDDAAIFTQVMRFLARTRPELKRDVLLMLNADEESSGTMGARWMVESHWDKVDCEFVLNEGGQTWLRDGKVVLYAIQAAEKVYNDFRLWIRGDSGHSAVPLPKNAIYDLGRILERLERFRTPVRLNETTSAFFAGLADLPAYAAQKDTMKKAGAGDAGAAEELCSVPRFNAALRTTFVPTIVRGGIRANVLPPDVEVNFNARLLPGDTLDDLVKALMGYLEVKDYALVEGDAAAIEKWKRENKEAAVAVFVVERGLQAPASPLDTDLYRALVAAAQKAAPGALAVPRMGTGATDSRFFRLKGVTCYGIDPCPTGEEEGTPHDHNERVRVESVEAGFRFVLEAVLQACQ